MIRIVCTVVAFLPPTGALSAASESLAQPSTTPMRAATTASPAPPSDAVPEVAPPTSPDDPPAPAAAAEEPPANPAPASPAADDGAAAAASGDESELPADQLMTLDPKTKGDLEQRLKSLDGAGLSDEDKAKAVAFYQQAIESFDVATQQVAAALAFQKDLDDLPAKAADYADRLAKPLPPLEDVSGEPIAAIEERAAKSLASLTHCRQEQAATIAEPKRRAQRLSEMPKLLADAQQRLKELSAELESLGGGEETTDIVKIARRASLAQAKTALGAAIQSIKREQQLYADGAPLLKLRREYYARYVPHKERRLAALTEEINRRRESEAASQVAAAADAIAKAQGEAVPAIVTQLATENKELAEQRSKVVADLNAVSKQISESEARYRSLIEEFERARENDSVDELAAVNGQLLREQQNKLPNLRALRRRIAELDEKRAAALLLIYRLNDQQSKLTNLGDMANKLAAEAGDLGDETRDRIRRQLETKRATLEQVVDDFTNYSRRLAELHANESQLIAETERYAAFIAERVLWIRSSSPLSTADMAPAVDAARWSLDPANWKDAGRAILQTLRQKPGQSLLYAVGVLFLLGSQRPARRRLRDLGEEAAKRNCVRLRPTLDALWLTILLALPWPALLVFFSWTLDSLNAAEFVRSLGVALRTTAVCLLLVELTRHLCRRDGLADSHFDWSQACLHHVRRRMLWLAAVTLPIVLWLVGLETQQQEPTSTSSLWSPSLGRALFMAVMLVLAKFLHRTLLAKKSPFREVNLLGYGLLQPFRIVWRQAVTLLPAALAAMAAIGYYYTAQQAAVRILETFAMLLSVATLGGMTRRWLLVNRRKLAREQARQRRAAMAQPAETDPEAPPAPDAVDDLVDLAALSEQTQKLLRMFVAVTTVVGLGLIWAPILPALAYPAEKLLPGASHLTWGMLGMFLVILAVAYVAVRDVPALLELAILQHLPLDSGSRYAITTLCRYILTAVGLTAACNAVELKWSSIQWLVAAMSVGLGFGLQEIFANFVSGIILLFERPIRVGDIITLGDKTGSVTRIRMRATTIIDWEKKEYIVPNKDLVTGRLLNWTLTDHMNRIGVNVGVARWSDTDLACRLLIEAAREQPHVMNEPAPIAFFESFGDSAFNLKLFCHLPNLENRTATIHSLHSTIARKFKEAGLDIPFPQRDLNIRFDRENTSIDLEEKNFMVGQSPTRTSPAAAALNQPAKQQGAA